MLQAVALRKHIVLADQSTSHGDDTITSRAIQLLFKKSPRQGAYGLLSALFREGQGSSSFCDLAINH